ncbi:MAG: alpha/beta hydrolase [Pseudomonadota bacterium]
MTRMLLPGKFRAWLKLLAAALIGALLAAIVAVVLVLNGRQDLSVWHLVTLDEEFTTRSDVDELTDYLTLEARLFEQLDRLVYANVPTTAEHALNRYSRDSLSDPGRWSTNWNRTFVWQPDAAPRAGVLLLHGLSDSPYSMRTLGQSLRKHGASVIGLRLPGHGTAPAALLDTRWQDMAAAVRLAVQHLRQTTGDAPLYIIGYSNGGALAINYALDAIDNPTMPRADGIVLLSPEIGLSRAAAFAVWQGRLGRVLGLEKLAWNDILPEYDPFKYSSFAINAGDLAYRITAHVERALKKRAAAGQLQQLPPILAFQSSVDATVTATALVDRVFDRLPRAHHELVLFDINRLPGIDMFLGSDPRTRFEPLLRAQARNFDLTLITNEDRGSARAVAITRRADTNTPDTPRYIGDWPADVYSLSHVALPFAPTDPLYGGPDATDSPGVALGNIAFRGERGVLQISGTAALRLRWNPFFAYLEQRTLDFIGLATYSDATGEHQNRNQPRTQRESRIDHQTGHAEATDEPVDPER